MVKLTIKEFNNTVIITILGAFNIHNLKMVEDVWNEQLTKKPTTIALDCCGLESLDSSAIGTTVKFFNSAMDRNIRLVFFDLNPMIQKLFATAKLTRFFTITTGEEFRATHLKDMPACERIPETAPGCNEYVLTLS